MTPDSFGSVYQALKREEARKNVTSLFLTNQACNGDADSITAFQEHLSAWLPAKEAGKSSKLAEFRAMLQSKGKLVKKKR